ncbi:MAG: hypothetical protein NTAFB01_42000 [Nitrospira sp.]
MFRSDALGGGERGETAWGRAFIKNATCDSSVCTYPYGDIDPVKNITFYSTQPPFGQCTDVNPDPNKCIGDDTLHAVLPKAYTWPNDPQVYGGDATAYRIIFAPGGTPVPITPAGDIPMCSDLPTILWVREPIWRGEERK